MATSCNSTDVHSFSAVIACGLSFQVIPKKIVQGGQMVWCLWPINITVSSTNSTNSFNNGIISFAERGFMLKHISPD